MSRLDELIQQYCPDGVEWKTFAEVFETITDYTAAGSFKNIADNVQYLKVPDYAMLIRTTDLKSNFTKGGFIYVSQSAFNYLWRVNMDKECIVMPNVGNCGEIYYAQPQDLPYEHCALAPNAILVRSNTYNNRYLSYCLQVEDFQRQLNKITSPVGQSKFNKTDLKKLALPIPPLPVQEEIVRILDNFTELQTELQKRLQQYNYYRDFLLSFEGRSDVEWIKLGDIASIKTGRRFVRTDIRESGVPCFHYGDLYTYYGLTAKRTKGYLDPELASKLRFAQPNDVVVVCAGENDMDLGVGVAWLGDEPAVVHDACCILHHNQSPRYISHFLRTHNYHLQMKKYVKNGKISSLPASGLAEALIPLPSLEEQERIAGVLDRFDTLTNDLTAGLPAEIEKRRQQYEYYRDKLLTFKRKAA